jgi:hypothetical protein
MLLWPRLDRARLRRMANDPVRIAELVEHRTAQPYAVILAMLTRQNENLAPEPAQTSDFDAGRSEVGRVGLRIVRSEERTRIEVHDLLRA